MTAAATAPELIVALDRPLLPDALALVDALGDECRFYKVGLELFTAAGPAAVDAIRARDADVFLDLKLHDIPATVAGATRRAAALGVRLLTVHASGGVAMVRAAVEAARDETERAGTMYGGCKILAVTVLTSLDRAALATAWGRSETDPPVEVQRLASLAAEAGAYGVVCSGAEVGAVRDAFPALAVLVPGLRLAGGTAHDQARVSTPVAAARAGARYLVLGRAVTGAADPRAALAAVRTSLGAGHAG